MYEVLIKKQITEEQLENIVIDGIEGGISGWGLIHNDAEVFKQYNSNTMSLSEKVFEIIKNNGSVKITDIEGEVEIKYELTIESLLKGIIMNFENRPWDCDLDNYDAITCDCIFQYAIFEDIIFG